MTDLLLGVDVGGTATKAVLFDLQGRVVRSSSRLGSVLTSAGGFVERDMEEVWLTTCDAIASCVSPIDAGRVAAVGVVGHSDGLYLIDDRGRPTRRAIQATDTRASDIAATWRRSEVAEEVLALTGTVPFAGSPTSLSRWMSENEPSILEDSSWLLFAKDWIRYRLVGEVGTDYTDPSGSFLDTRSATYSSEALALLGLGNIEQLLPPMSHSQSVAGVLTEAAANECGLTAGTPVVVGAHDVDAAAIGLGGVDDGSVSIAIGTFSINQVLTSEIKLDPKWQVRAFVEPGRWLAMSTSPTSASNLEWMGGVLEVGGGSRIPALLEEAVAVAGDESGPVFLPYVFGSPEGDIPGALVGVRREHTRGHLVQALLEGVVCSHRLHLEWLAEQYSLEGTARLTGGALVSEHWMQLFADGLGAPVELGDGFDTARGAAALGAIGVGRYSKVPEASAAMSQVDFTIEPSDDGMSRLDHKYQRFLETRESMRGL